MPEPKEYRKFYSPFLFLVFLSFSSFFSLPLFAEEEAPDTRKEQDFLFRVDEAYTQESFEVQVNTGFEFLKSKATEQEFEGSFDDVEKKSQRIHTISMPLEFEIGLTDRIQIQAETAYESRTVRSTEISAAGTRGRATEDDFTDTELGATVLVVGESEESLLPAIALSAALKLPTGDEKENELAENRTGYEWTLLVSKHMEASPFPGDLFVHFNIGFGITPHVQAINEELEPSKPHKLRELQYGFAAVWQSERHFSLMLELFHEIEEEIELNHRVSESNLELVPGFSVRGDLNDYLEWELGFGFPLGLTTDANDWGFVTQLKLEA